MKKSAMGLGAVVLVAVLGAAVFMIWTGVCAVRQRHPARALRSRKLRHKIQS